MGGYFCGGQNKTHGCTTQCKRLDSFHCGKALPLMAEKGLEVHRVTMRWKDGDNIGLALYPGRMELHYLAGEGEARREIHATAYLDPVENNYGGPPRIYFRCPSCSRRCRFLYLRNLHFKCRQCAELNYYSQQVSKGTDEAAYKMQRFIREKFGVEESMSPAEAVDYFPARPKGMHRNTYFRLLEELGALQYQYDREFVAMAYKMLPASWQ